MRAQDERNLGDVLAFAAENDERSALDLLHPWPEDEDVLLRDPVGGESWFHHHEEWVPNEYARLVFYAMQYQEAARELVRHWLPIRHNPEASVFAIGFMYRQAIELYMKAVISTDATFQAKTLDEQFETLQSKRGHDLVRLWGELEQLLHGYGYEARELATPARLVRELAQLDQGADGFRYPFRFDRGRGGKVLAVQTLLSDIGYKSADNFVWILEALTNWLSSIRDQRQLHYDHLAEMEREAGLP